MDDLHDSLNGLQVQLSDQAYILHVADNKSLTKGQVAVSGQALLAFRLERNCSAVLPKKY